MRIVLDLQACQSGSRFRGIGRYSKSLAKEMIRECSKRGHEVVCLFNASFPEEMLEMKLEVRKVDVGVKCVSFMIPLKCNPEVEENEWRQYAAQILREHAIACLKPDFVHVSTFLGDGWGDDAITSVDRLSLGIPTAFTHYDLIPLVHSNVYLPEGRFKKYYEEKINYLKRANLLLSISNYSRVEAIEWLGMPASNVVNISSAVEDDFHIIDVSEEYQKKLLNKFNIKKNYILYAPGGFDQRKNITKLLEAYSMLSVEVRAKNQLVIASKTTPEIVSNIRNLAVSLGIDVSSVVLTDYVSDIDLKVLYKCCLVYIFPSLHEGFGLPILEAMSCGAPVIGSNQTSIPEVVGVDDGLFDPNDVKSIMEKMNKALMDESFRGFLRQNAITQVTKFSWKNSARTAIDAIEDKLKQLNNSDFIFETLERHVELDEIIFLINSLTQKSLPTEQDYYSLEKCYLSNLQINNF